MYIRTDTPDTTWTIIIVCYKRLVRGKVYVVATNVAMTVLFIISGEVVFASIKTRSLGVDSSATKALSSFRRASYYYTKTYTRVMMKYR